MSEKIREEISEAVFYENPFYVVTNSIASLWFSRACLERENVTIINGDIVVEERLVKDYICRRVKRPEVLIDSSIKNSGDYNVQVNDGRILVMSKELEDYYGEYAGITKLDQESSLKLKRCVEQMVQGGMYDQWYENALVQMIFNEDDWFTDIRDFDARKYVGKVDIVVGGAPCQAFSMVGHRLGFEDARGTLFYEFARVVKETQPKVFLFENVRGLLNHDKGRTWHVIHDIFEELGYDVKFRVLNSCDYGIPQHRERVYCLGFKKKTKFEYPAPIELEYRMYDFLEDFIDTKYFLREKGVKKSREIWLSRGKQIRVF